jgi:outer membrane protein OmpA-like peptidoglycan-associated protein
MGERALAAALEEAEDVARKDRADKASPGESPGTRLLDAMRAGDEVGMLAVCSESTTVSADNMNWSCRGRDEIHDMLADVRRRFPGITFESRTRHVGFGLVIDEARVQDARPDGDDDSGAADASSVEAPAKHLAAPGPAPLDPDIHPMWDEPAVEERNVMAVWREATHEDLTPAPLNMPVRVTVRHDDLQVHEVTLSFPAALLKRALGMHVDRLEMSLSEVQSAFIAPVGAGLTSYTLARPELALVPPSETAAPERWTPEDEPPRRRRRILAPVLVALVAVVAAGGWWAVQGNDGNVVADPPTPSPSHEPSTQPSASTSPSVSSTKAPTVTHEQPSNAPSREPNVTLTSALAFGTNSAKLSAKAKTKIDEIASEVRRAGLTGKIYVDGYTDNRGSAAYGKVLSQQRADAVSTYLGSQLVGVPVTILSIAHGEADPIASNSTEAGRQANRRVTITLPKP